MACQSFERAACQLACRHASFFEKSGCQLAQWRASFLKELAASLLAGVPAFLERAGCQLARWRASFFAKAGCQLARWQASLLKELAASLLACVPAFQKSWLPACSAACQLFCESWLPACLVACQFFERAGCQLACVLAFLRKLAASLLGDKSINFLSCSFLSCPVLSYRDPFNRSDKAPQNKHREILNHEVYKVHAIDNPVSTMFNQQHCVSEKVSTCFGWEALLSFFCGDLPGHMHEYWAQVKYAVKTPLLLLLLLSFMLS